MFIYMKAFQLKRITKRFGLTVALEDVTFSGESGEIHGLIGENGAGKSTLIKILSGVHEPDSGEIEIMGKEVSFQSPLDGMMNNIAVVHQELSLLPDLTVAENIYIQKNKPSNLMNIAIKKKVEKWAEQHLHELGIHDIDPASLVGMLSLHDQQLIEIAKVMSRKNSILVLDEPTSALGIKDVEWLFNLVEKLSKQGLSIIYISHRMDEIQNICKRLTVLRNGKNVGTYLSGELNENEIVKLMIGRSIDMIFPDKATRKVYSKTSITVKNLHTKTKLRGTDFVLNKGEVLGVAALQGQGQKEIFECMFGITPYTKGEIIVNNKVVHFRHPHHAISKGESYNIGYVPGDRRTEGLIVEMPVMDNAILPILNKISRFGLISRKNKIGLIMKSFQSLKIDINKINHIANSLSGGNQQKLVLAKWLITGCNIMLMYDPTRGVDIGTKAEIFKLIRLMANNGQAILFYSSEIKELIGLCDRIIGIYRGKVIREFSENEISEEGVLSAMFGLSSEKVSVNRT